MKKVEEKLQVIGVYPICNGASINVYGVEYGIDGKIIASLNNQKPRKYKLYSNSKGEYFNFGGNRIYLHEVMRVE